MNPSERNDFRKKKLIELYDYYFENNQEWKNVVQETKEDAEARTAYDYLQQKGLIVYTEQNAGDQIFRADAKINAYGIDVIELDQELR